MASLVWRGFTPFLIFVGIALCIDHLQYLPDRRRHSLHQSSKAILFSITHFVMEDDTQSSLAAAAAVVPRRSGRERRQAESVYDDATAAAAAAKRKKSRTAEASETRCVSDLYTILFSTNA